MSGINAPAFAPARLVPPTMRSGGFGGGAQAPALILDTFPAATAYSLASKETYLGGDYTGPAVNVVRSSDQNDSDFYPDGAGGLEDSGGTSVVDWVGAGNDGTVVILYDRTGNGNDLDKINGADPLSGTARVVISGALITVNGKVAMYNGAADWAIKRTTGITAAGLSATGARSMLLVCGAGADSIYAGLSDGVTGDRKYVLVDDSFSTSSVTVRYGSHARGASPHPDVGAHQITFTAEPGGGDTDEARLWFNGVEQTGLTDVNGFAISLDTDWSGYYLIEARNHDAGHRFQENILWPTDETPNQAAIQAAVNDYYSAY